ncbi:alpha/beta hydrolase [Kurthia gibsonii]|uniref:alpha/beta hydrolase n=1 Tax=Kurthia gibsonii TaxID=33946 RepID=UPI0031B72612
MKSPFTFEHTAPKEQEAGKLYPAVFLLHGMGSNEKDLPGLLTELQDEYHIFSLRGPITQAPGYAFFIDEDFGKPDRQIFDKIVLHIQAFIEEAIQTYSIDATKVFVLGFSQGATLAETLPFVLGTERLAGAIALSGYLPGHVKEEYSKRSVASLPVFISHGKMDYVLPYQWGEEARDFYKDQQANVIFMAFEDGHGVTPEVQREIIRFLKQHIS